MYGLKKFKIGHAGTLDPLATGLLLVCVGTTSVRELPPFLSTTPVPAGTGVILQGTHNQEYTLTATDAAATARDINYSLRPVVIDYALPATYSTGEADNANWDNYILVKDGESMVFKQSDGTGNIAAGKAYFCIRRDQAKPAAARLTLNFDDDATGIESPNVLSDTKEYFNLQGQRTAAPQKGLYIVNGKKVIMK